MTENWFSTGVQIYFLSINHFKNKQTKKRFALTYIFQEKIQNIGPFCRHLCRALPIPAVFLLHVNRAKFMNSLCRNSMTGQHWLHGISRDWTSLCGEISFPLVLSQWPAECFYSPGKCSCFVSALEANSSGFIDFHQPLACRGEFHSEQH